MSKYLFEISVNGKTQDCIVNHYMAPLRDDCGIIYTNKNEGIAKVKGEVYSIDVYLKDEADGQKFSKVQLTALGIKNLYALINEIEEKTGEEFVDD